MEPGTGGKNPLDQVWPPSLETEKPDKKRRMNDSTPRADLYQRLIRRCVVRSDDVAPGCRDRRFAFSELYERPESGKDLNVVQAWIIDLNIASSKLDLRNHVDARHGTDFVRCRDVSVRRYFVGYLPSYRSNIQGNAFFHNGTRSVPSAGLKRRSRSKPQQDSDRHDYGEYREQSFHGHGVLPVKLNSATLHNPFAPPGTNPESFPNICFGVSGSRLSWAKHERRVKDFGATPHRIERPAQRRDRAFG